MEFLKCKAIIALVAMVLGVSYIGASENVAIQSHTQDDGVDITLNS